MTLDEAKLAIQRLRQEAEHTEFRLERGGFRDAAKRAYEMRLRLSEVYDDLGRVPLAPLESPLDATHVIHAELDISNGLIAQTVQAIFPRIEHHLPADRYVARLKRELDERQEILTRLYDGDEMATRTGHQVSEGQR